MTDLSEFNPETVDELAAEIGTRLGALSAEWWEANRDVVGGYVRVLAEATLQTRLALAQGRISEEVADLQMHNQELAFNQVLLFSKFMTRVLAQKALNIVVEVVSQVIANKTGIKLF